MKYLWQYVWDGFTDWCSEKWAQLRQFAKAQWAKVRARNTGDE
jgi:hypothetical protein